MRALRVVLLAGCTLAAALRAYAADNTCSFDAAARGKFAEVARAAGATVRTGGFAVWSADESCIADGDCGNLNPTSPYAAATLPTGPGGAPRTDWPLAQGEVVVLWACVPPRARYVGYTPYQHTQLRNGTRRYTVFASLGDTASAGTGGAAGAGNAAAVPTFSRLNSSAGAVPGGNFSRAVLPFGAETALLMSASPAAVAAVRELLAPLLSSRLAINVLPIPEKYYETDATYSLYQRYALPDNPSAWAAWMAAPPVSVWAVTPAVKAAGPRVPRLPAAYPLPALIPKTGISEAWLQPAADALAAKVAAYFASAGASNVSVHSAARGNPMQSGAFCINTFTNCGGDNRDTTYVQALPVFVLPDIPTALVVVVGANHRATGNGHYANVAVYDSDVRLGVTAAADDELGVALSWLRGTPYEDAAGSLYVLALSRSCPPWLPMACLRVPSVGWPRAPVSHYLTAVERPYAAQDTSVGPNANALVLPKLVLVDITATRAPPPPPEPGEQQLRERVASARAALNSMRTAGQQEDPPAPARPVALLRTAGGG